MEELIRQIREFARERDWEEFHSPKNLAMALSVEVAEIAEHFQWLTQTESKNLDRGKLAEVEEEIADVLIYLTRLADRLGIDPIEAARKKMRINAKKYPVETSKGKAAKYSEI
ncbi:MAG: nucleotide pyrophosphohydrolase [Desulfobacterales bacterium]|nr:nucleotide pyrophosphohydrolase [Desulfobacterales bacterium]